MMAKPKRSREQLRAELQAETARLVERIDRAAREEAYWGNGPPPKRTFWQRILG